MNRFVRRIRSGEIDSPDQLKTEFKTLAKQSHPDLARDLGGEAFVAMRAEYEDALRDFERHRFSARRTEGRPAPRQQDGIGDEVWLRLGLFLKRGFPKRPTHEKQKLRYEFARWRLLERLGRELQDSFEGFEDECLSLQAKDPPKAASLVALLRALLDYEERGIPAMRTHIVLALGAIRRDEALDRGALRFVDALAAELGIGAELE